MNTTAGQRLRAMRELMGLTREEFAEIFSLDPIRIRNIELGRTRMAEEEFAAVGRRYPDLVHWLTYEGDIFICDMKDKTDPFIKVLVAKLEGGLIPEGYHLQERVKLTREG